MSKHRFTPGPWRYDGCNIKTKGGGTLRVVGVALPVGRIPSDDEAYGNARMISALPDLYEACGKALTCASIDSSVRQLIVTALAKARGEATT